MPHNTSSTQASKKDQLSYKIAFFVTLAALVIVTITAAFLAHRKVVVQGFTVIQGSNGQILAVTSIDKHILTHSTAELRSDLTNYVERRMSFMARNKADVLLWQHYINWHSSDAVFDAFISVQNSADGFLQTLGFDGSARATVVALSFVGSSNGKPTTALADVAQTIVDKNGVSTVHHYRVTLAWKYTGVPHNYEIALNNWSGFEVTRYDVTHL